MTLLCIYCNYLLKLAAKTLLPGFSIACLNSTMEYRGNDGSLRHSHQRMSFQVATFRQYAFHDYYEQNLSFNKDLSTSLSV